jgi:hypothetical protein
MRSLVGDETIRRTAPVRYSRGPISRLTSASIWHALWLSILATSLGIIHGQASADAEPEPVLAADSLGAVPQRDVTDIFRAVLHRSVPTEVVNDPRRGLSLTLLPSIGYNPAYGSFAGASIAIGGWLGDPVTSDLSSGAAGASYSTSGQISVQFKSDFFLPGNAWGLKGDWRYLDTSQATFGLGSPATPTSYPMDFVLYRLHQTVYRRMGSSSIYVGVGYHFDRYDQIHDERAEQGEPTPFSVYSGGTPSRTQSTAVSADILVDNRDNPINASRGLFWSASMRSYLSEIGSDDDRQSLWSDFRSYCRFPRGARNVLAIWNYMWFTFGKAPYLDLPAIGWDTYGRSGRGFLQGHLRGSDQAYVEFEYRMRFTRDGLWGGVGFLNLTYTTQSNSGPFGTADAGFGVGLRVKFNKTTDTNLAVDAARGQDNTTRLFFGLQEVF